MKATISEIPPPLPAVTTAPPRIGCEAVGADNLHNEARAQRQFNIDPVRLELGLRRNCVNCS